MPAAEAPSRLTTATQRDKEDIFFGKVS